MRHTIMALMLALATLLPTAAYGKWHDKTLTEEVKDFVENDGAHYGESKVDTKAKQATNQYEMKKYDVEPRTEDTGWGWLKSIPTVLKYVAYTAVGAVLLFLLYLVYNAIKDGRWNPGGDKKEKKTAGNTALGSDDIHNHNFGKEIEDFVRQGDYNGAIRLVYLHSLFTLDKHKHIAWTESKTPTEYYYELKAEKPKPTFFQLTGIYLQVRYGNAAATEPLFRQAEECGKTIVKLATPVDYERK